MSGFFKKCCSLGEAINRINAGNFVAPYFFFDGIIGSYL